MQIRDVMTHGAEVIRSDAMALEAAEKMRRLSDLYRCVTATSWKGS